MSDKKGPLNLSGEQYWNDPLSFKGDIGVDRLEAHVDGMLLDAPSTVNVSTHKTIPLVCHRSGESEKLHVYNLETTTQLVASNLETGMVQVVKLAESPSRNNEPPPSPGWSTDWLEADLAARVALGQKIGRYSVWLVCGPDASNKRTVELYSEQLKPGSQSYSDKLREIRNNATPKYDPAVAAKFDFQPSKISGNDDWVFTQEKGPHGETRLRIQYHVIGVPGLIFPPQEKKSDPAGRRLFGHLPMQVFGFGKNRTLSILSKVDLPLLEKPEGSSDYPILSGNISFVLADLKRDGIRDKPLDLWAVALEHRAYLQVKPEHPK